MLILANLLALALVAAEDPAVQTPTLSEAPFPMPKIPKRVISHNPEADEVWQVTLPEAIRIGLERSPVVRVIAPGAEGTPPGGFEPTPLNPKVENPRADRPGIVIARLNTDASAWNFKAALMAHVRSIEQQYWALSMLQVNLWARETAIKLGEEILAREKTKFAEGRATKADIAEIEQQLENYKLNLVSATSDVITTERQLRNILGLAPEDGRRIVACTAPTEAELNPDWEKCIAAMLASQPDIAEHRQALNVARLKALIEADNPTLSAEQRDASGRELEKQQEALKQITHQTTHSLARFFLEIDANYKQFKTAARLREAAQRRLEAQRAFYEEEKITVDRLLDAVTQYANAIAQESQYKSSYNTSIAAFEEARGTILSYEGVTIATLQEPSKARHEAKDDRVAPAAFVAAQPAPVAPIKAQPAPAATTYKLRAKLGLMKILDVELEVCPSSK